MYTNTRKYKAIVLLLPLILAMRINVYGRSTAERPQDRTEQSSSIQTSTPAIQTNSMYRWLRQLMSPLLGAGRSIAASGMKHQERRLPSSEFGREDPFMRLVVEPYIMSAVKRDNRESGNSGEPDSLKTGILDRRLIAIFVGDASYAIIEEYGISRSVYVGDTVAGMKVMEIRRGEVSMSKGDKSLTMTLGVLPKAMEESEL